MGVGEEEGGGIDDDDDDDGGCERVVRKTGHSSIARERVLRRNGRKVSLV